MSANINTRFLELIGSAWEGVKEGISEGARFKSQ